MQPTQEQTVNFKVNFPADTEPTPTHLYELKRAGVKPGKQYSGTGNVSPDNGAIYFDVYDDNGFKSSCVVYPEDYTIIIPEIKTGAIEFVSLNNAIEAARMADGKNVICQMQDDNGFYRLFPIDNLRINDEMDPCYQVAKKNNAIAIAVCGGNKFEHSLNYCDL